MTTTDEIAVRAIDRGWDAAWNRGDVDALVALVMDDAVLISPTGVAASGRAAITTALREFLDGPGRGSRHTTTVNRVRVIDGMLAVVDGIARIDFAAGLEPGAQSLHEHSFTDVLVKTDGRWLLSDIRAYDRAREPVRADQTAAFLAISRKKLVDTDWPRLRECVESLTDEQVWWRPNEASNSIGNLLLHLSGNVRQWLVSSFADRGDHRDRPAEFAERHHMPRAELLRTLGATIEDASGVLGRLNEADLERTFVVQGYTTSGLEAVYHVVEHFSMHCGQIFYITKMLRGESLGFYRELDKTGRREP